MAIFSDKELEDILNEKCGISDRLSERKDEAKKIKDKAVENFKNNTSRKKKKTMKIKLDEEGNLIDVEDGYESLEEAKHHLEINGKSYRLLTSDEAKKVEDPNSDIITYKGKVYICDALSQTDTDPNQTIGRVAGTIVGSSIGAATGGFTGRAIGAVAGYHLGRKAEYGLKKLRYNSGGLINKKIHKENSNDYIDGEDYISEDGYESLEEIFINDKKYRPVTKNDEKNGVSLKDAIIINGKKYIYDNKEQSKYNKKHPIEYIGKKAGSIAGGTVGGVLGGATGAVAGAGIGGTVGAVAGASIGSTKSGHAVSKGIRNIASVPSKIKKKIKREDFDFRNVYRSKEFTMAMEQYFDTVDNENRRILLSINEEDQNRVLVGLTSKLYENIIDKVDDIDFGEIPMTKGDITKLSNYTTMIECIETMTKLLIEFKQDTKPIDTIRTTIVNIADSVSIWKKAFINNIELPMVVYNTTVLAIIEAITYMISMCVEYIKVPSSDTFQITIDKSALNKTKDHMVFDNLVKFNDAYRKGQIKNAMEYVIKENVKNFAGTTIGVGSALIGITALLFCIIPIIRELIFLFYYNRVRISEFFDLQASMLQINAYNVENNRLDLNKEQKKRITTKQINIAEKFRKIANKIGVKMKDSEHTATKELANENRKYKVDDVVDELPDSASSALF